MKASQPRVRALFICALTFLFVPAALAQTTATEVRDESDVPLLRLNTDGGLIGFGSFGAGAIPIEGRGARLMWYPRKAAFRVGGVQGGFERMRPVYNSTPYTSGTEWDDENVGAYSVAMGMDAKASGDYSFAFGRGSYAEGTDAIAIGHGNSATGDGSVALGYRAHTNNRNGSFIFADRSSDMEFRVGVQNTANWRVSGGFRIFTASNESQGITFQTGTSVSNWGQSSAVISTSTGALLTIGGVWQNASDSTRKHLFEPVSGEDVLARLRTLPIQRWSYRSEPDSVRHMGPTSQDFRAIFGLGGDERSIGTVDADGVALAAAQALEARTRAQEAQLAALRAENEALRARLDALEAGRRPFTAGIGVLVFFALLFGGVATVRARHRPALLEPVPSSDASARTS